MVSFSIVVLSGSVLDLDGTALVHLVVFFLALFLLRGLVFRPMVQLFDARREATDGAREAARTMERDAKSKAATFDEEMRKVRLAAGEEREKLRLEGVKLERNILESVRTETQRQIATAQQKVVSDGRRLRAEIDGEVPVLARQIASKLLDRELAG